MQFTDEWLVPSLEKILEPGVLDGLREEPGKEPVSLWTTLVQRKKANDDDILKAAASRFRLPVADLNRADQKAREAVPEPLVRRFNIIPLGISDSYLEIATANPNDIDAEKDLAFATGHPFRHLAAPQLLEYQGRARPLYVLLHPAEFEHWPASAPRVVQVRTFQDERGQNRVLARTEVSEESRTPNPPRPLELTPPSSTPSPRSR